MPDSLRCASWVVYPTRGTSDLSRKLRDLVLGVKIDRLAPDGRSYADIIASDIARHAHQLLPGYLRDDAVLVPAPRSALPDKSTVWPARSLCLALREHGVATNVAELVTRVHPVAKSAGNQNRPGAQLHYESLKVELSLLEGLPACLIAVDDVVTRGCTLMGIARRLREVFPEVPILGFALARVQSVGDATAAREPAVESIVTSNGDACSRV